MTSSNSRACSLELQLHWKVIQALTLLHSSILNDRLNGYSPFSERGTAFSSYPLPPHCKLGICLQTISNFFFPISQPEVLPNLASQNEQECRRKLLFLLENMIYSCFWITFKKPAIWSYTVMFQLQNMGALTSWWTAVSIRFFRLSCFSAPTSSLSTGPAHVVIQGI